jgi:hypothetical protein
MRQLIRCALLVAFMAAPAFSEETSPRFSVGPRVGLGGVGFPGFFTGPVVIDIGAVLQKPVSQATSLVGGFEYQRVPEVSYAEPPIGPYSLGLLSAFVGFHTTYMPRSLVRPYSGATIGLTRWSGRPGDTGLSPTLGGVLGAQMSVRDQSRVFAEVGLRYGLRPVPGSVPHWSLGIGYTRAF